MTMIMIRERRRMMTMSDLVLVLLMSGVPFGMLVIAEILIAKGY